MRAWRSMAAGQGQKRGASRAAMRVVYWWSQVWRSSQWLHPREGRLINTISSQFQVCLEEAVTLFPSFVPIT